MAHVIRRERRLRRGSERIDDSEIGAFVRCRQLRTPLMEKLDVARECVDAALASAVGIESRAPEIGLIRPRHGIARRRYGILRREIIEAVNSVREEKPGAQKRVR